MLLLSLLIYQANTLAELSANRLIDALPDVTLPLLDLLLPIDSPGPGVRLTTLPLGNPFDQIVLAGPRMIPLLCAHITDTRLNKPMLQMKPPGHAITLLAFDRNLWPSRRPEDRYPELPDELPSADIHLTVGDICYFALLQIVNRNPAPFTTSAWVMCLPSQYPELAYMARSEWKNVTSRSLADSLEFDVLHPDTRTRDYGAIRRLMFYYPSEVDRVVMRKIRLVSSYSAPVMPSNNHFDDLEDGAYFPTFMSGLEGLKSAVVDDACELGTRRILIKKSPSDHDDLLLLGYLERLRMNLSRYGSICREVCELRIKGGTTRAGYFQYILSKLRSLRKSRE